MNNPLLAQNNGGAPRAIDERNSHSRGNATDKLERNHHMGDKKSKKVKAKGQRQKDAKQAKAAKQKQEKRQPRTS